MEILRQKGEAVNWLAVFRLANLENVLNVLIVANSSGLRSRAALMKARIEIDWLQEKESGLLSELILVRTQQEEADLYRQQMSESTAEVGRFCRLLTSSRDSTTDGISRFNGYV